MLPSELLTGEMNLNGKSGPKDSCMFRVQSTQTECGKMNLVSGYLVACPDAYIHLALFRDRKNARDIIAYVKDCGEVPIQSCDYGFLYFDPERKIWKNANNVFPFERMKEKCLKIEKKKNWFDRQEIMPYFILPEFGTTIKVMDSFSDDKHLLFTTKWNGERFEIQ